MTDTGTCVIVEGKVVAWFRDFDDSAEDWCRENHYGMWVTWSGKAPIVDAPTADELAKIRDTAYEILDKGEHRETDD